jgi:hypothetical protein
MNRVFIRRGRGRSFDTEPGAAAGLDNRPRESSRTGPEET